MKLRTLHYLADLATDAVEAIIHSFHSNHAADDLWDWTCAEKRLVEKEAEEEVSEPRCACGHPHVTPGQEQLCASLISKPSQSSPAALVVGADTAAGETPADSAPPSVAVGGHPNLTSEELWKASRGCRGYANYAVNRGDRDYAEQWFELASALDRAAADAYASELAK